MSALVYPVVVGRVWDRPAFAAAAKLREDTLAAVRDYMLAQGASPGDAWAVAEAVADDHAKEGRKVVALTADHLALYLRAVQDGAQ